MSELPLCLMCGTEVAETDDARKMPYGRTTSMPGLVEWTVELVHRECLAREVIGGIGHLEDHEFWCETMHDPDGGRTYRQSALEVVAWVREHGVSPP